MVFGNADLNCVNHQMDVNSAPGTGATPIAMHRSSRPPEGRDSMHLGALPALVGSMLPALYSRFT